MKVIESKSDWPLWAKQLANKRALEGYDPFNDAPLHLPFPGAGFPPVHRGHGVSPEFWEKVQNHGKRIGKRHRLVHAPQSVFDHLEHPSKHVVVEVVR